MKDGINYSDILAGCETCMELLSTYNALLDNCDDLSEIKNIDKAYREEFNRRKQNE